MRVIAKSVVPAEAGPKVATPVAARGPMRPAQLTALRQRLSPALLARTFRALDSLALGIALIAGLSGATPWLHREAGAVAPAILCALSIWWALKAFGAYHFYPREPWDIHLARVAAAVAAGLGVGAVVAELLGVSAREVEREAVAAAAALLVAHLGALTYLRRARKKGRLTPNIVVVGATPNASRLIEQALTDGSVNVLGIFDDRAQRAPRAIHGVPVLGDVAALMDHKITPYVDRVVITVAPAAEQRVRELIQRLRILPNAVTLFVDADGAAARVSALARMSGQTLDGDALNAEDRRAVSKRAQDLIIAGLALLLGWPVLVLIGLLVRLDSPGPVLFRQRRHGFNNEIITVWKFRTMRVETCDPCAAQQVRPDDDRVTRLGRFLRRTSLDELPQLINVLFGEMSMVGPRPHAVGMKTGDEESRLLVAEYAWRHRMRPGITGWAQINGSRGPVDTPESVRRRVELDVEYIERQSFWLDLYIILMTVPRLLGDKGAVR